ARTTLSRWRFPGTPPNVRTTGSSERRSISLRPWPCGPRWVILRPRWKVFTTWRRFMWPFTCAHAIGKCSTRHARPWAGRRTAPATADTEALLAHLARERSLIVGGPDDAGTEEIVRQGLESARRRWPDAILLDITVSQFGTVLVAGPIASPSVRLLSPNRTDI